MAQEMEAKHMADKATTENEWHMKLAEIEQIIVAEKQQTEQAWNNRVAEDQAKAYYEVAQVGGCSK